MKRLMIPAFCIATIACTSCNSNAENSNEMAQQYYAENGNMPNNQGQMQMSNNNVQNGGDQMVSLMDRGVGVPVGNILVPKGYQLQYDLFTNTQTGAYDRFWIELNGLSGEMLRGVAKMVYNRYNGQDFQAICRQLVPYGVSDLSNVQYGEANLDQARMNEPNVQQYRQKLLAQGMDLQVIALPFSAVRNGVQVRGRYEIVHQIFGNSNQSTGGFINMRLMLSPPAVFDKLMADVKRFDDAYQPNSQHDQLLAQIIDRQTDQNTMAHNQRMANQKQQFDAHQQKMQGIYAANDARNAQWMSNFRQGWSTNTGSSQTEYGQHESFLDAITERTSFDDPHLGQKVHRDGNYNHWYTDGNGQYHGTDDHNFQPQSLGNNWQSIEPLKVR